MAVISRRSTVDVRRRRWGGSGSAAEEVGFRPVNSPQAGTYIGRGSARMGWVKTFMGRAAVPIFFTDP
jgi:hypothetical protein